MTKSLEQSIAELLRASRNDEDATRFRLSDSIFGFHVQQAVEKLLEVLIAAHVQPFELTHSISKLVEQLTTLGELLPVDIPTIESLTNFAVVWRYQDMPPLPGGERKSLRAIVRNLRNFVVGRLVVLQPAVDRSEFTVGIAT